MAFIYKITNKVNGKVYIGKTEFSVEDRFKRHLENFNQRTKNFPLYLAMRKYGVENFIVEVLEFVKSEMVDQREVFWISHFDSYGSGGYNATRGGDGNTLYDYGKVVSLHNDGLSVWLISEKTGYDRKCIKNYLLSNGYVLNKHRKRRTDGSVIDTEKIIELYQNGNSLNSIAKTLKIAYGSVKHHLIKNGVINNE